jgi:prepilin-type N-terminal cleavage/methylation domain-containing protein
MKSYDWCYGRSGRRGFTLLEMLAVVGIIGLLVGLLIPVVGKAAAKARQTKCKSNLRQFAVALNVYRSENRGHNPGWLSNLYPDYIDTRDLYVCPTDRSHGLDGGKPGHGGNRQQRDYEKATQDTSQFEEADDTSSNGSANGRNTAIARCSYLYEFNAAPCSRSASNTWQEAKLEQLRNGDADNGHQAYSESRLPIIRCFHHWTEGQVWARDAKTGYRFRDHMTLNVGYAGNIFVAPLEWEERVDGVK